MYCYFTHFHPIWQVGLSPERRGAVAENSQFGKESVTFCPPMADIRRESLALALHLSFRDGLNFFVILPKKSFSFFPFLLFSLKTDPISVTNLLSLSYFMHKLTLQSKSGCVCMFTNKQTNGGTPLRSAVGCNIPCKKIRRKTVPMRIGRGTAWCAPPWGC